MWHPYGMGMGMVTTFGVAVPLLLAGLAAVLILLAVRGRTGRSAATPQGILAERYARGEIDEAEYARRTAVLDARRTTAVDDAPAAAPPQAGGR